LLKNQGLVKGVNFKNYKYVGDPINAVNIYNAKEVDELIFLDINATKTNSIPPIELVEKIADECYMPFAVGGGIRSIKDVRKLLYAGAEKVSINTSAVTNPDLIREIADVFGSQSVVVSIDTKKNWRGKYEIYGSCGERRFKIDPISFAIKMQEYGAGELLVNSIDRDGTLKGYDIELLRKITSEVSIPVIACGGAGKLQDLDDAIKVGGCSAAAAGSFFVFHGPKRAVLINFPTKEEREAILH
jgi:cyclase